MGNRNTGIQNLIAAFALGLMIVGAYHVAVNWLWSPILTTLDYLSSMRFENKVLLAIFSLGIFAIWAFRTREPKKNEGTRNC
jgi:hypothetical protein